MRNDRGFTLLELLVVMGVMSIMTSMALINLREFNITAANAANDVASLIKRARAYAMSSTKTVMVKPLNNGHIQATQAQSCSDTTRSAVSELEFDLPSGAYLPSTTWSVCFTSRGVSQESLDIYVNDASTSRTIQVVLGGGIRVL